MGHIHMHETHMTTGDLRMYKETHTTETHRVGALLHGFSKDNGKTMLLPRHLPLPGTTARTSVNAVNVLNEPVSAQTHQG